jgi:hypothetical protein
MSPSVMALPARNFKFLTEGSLERTRNYRLCEKEGRVEIGAVTLGFHFQIPLIKLNKPSAQAPKTCWLRGVKSLIDAFPTASSPTLICLKVDTAPSPGRPITWINLTQFALNAKAPTLFNIAG